MALMWGFSSLAIYRLQTDTVYTISSLVPSMAYISDPITLAYQFRSISIAVKPSLEGSNLLISIKVITSLQSHILNSHSTFLMYPFW